MIDDSLLIDDNTALESYSASPGMHDVGVQCCFEPITQRSIATQTDVCKASASEIAFNKSGIGISSPVETEINVPQHPKTVEWKVSHDHSYSMNAPANVIFPTHDEDSLKTIPLTPVHNVLCNQYDSTDAVDTGYKSDVDDETIDNDKDDEDKDPSWKFSDAEHFLSDDDMGVEPSEEEFQESPPDREKKFVVFGSCLNELLKRCPECGDAIIQQKSKTCGSMLTVELTCHSGHTKTWESQPVVKRKPLGNLLFAAAILFTGNTLTSISNLALCVNLQFFCESVFYDTQRKYLFPVINEAWEAESNSQIEKLTSKAVVNLEGDGRCDSPGHCAKYGTYTLMDEDTGNVVAFSVVQVSEVSSSNAMEKEGFTRCMEMLEGKGVNISRVATDRHVSISSCMSKDYPHISHQYHVWHLSKWVVKKLTNKAKQKGCEELAPWIQSISNHLWWSAATCDGSVQLLAEKWRSLLDHVSNKHKWSGNSLFHKCFHRHISLSEAKKICWIKPGTPAHLALEEVVLNTKLLKDIAKLTDFCHTGKMEVYHSMMLKYCSKREHFSYKGMVARTQLAALDNNANTGRSQAQIKEGERAGEARYKLCFPKANKRWVVKPINEKKSFQYLSGLLSDVVKRVELGNTVAQPVPVRLP